LNNIQVIQNCFVAITNVMVLRHRHDSLSLCSPMVTTTPQN